MQLGEARKTLQSYPATCFYPMNKKRKVGDKASARYAEFGMLLVSYVCGAEERQPGKSEAIGCLPA
jgi:hypothetical protein